MRSANGWSNALSTERLTDRPTILRLLKSAGIRPSKKLGQNFLTDGSVLETICDHVRAVGPGRIVEIGPGLGTVTQVIAPLAEHVTAVEIDRRLVGILERTMGEHGHVDVRQQDVLTFDFAEVAADGPVFVVGNIPYRITAPILKHLIRHRESITGAVLLTQSEVADKILASPGVDGTALGILVQAFAEVNMIRRVGRSGFYPAPEVDSSLWSLAFRSQPVFSADPAVFFAVVRAIFGMRRKMIRVALRSILPKEAIPEVLTAAGIEETLRGEVLGFDSLDRLALASAGRLLDEALDNRA